MLHRHLRSIDGKDSMYGILIKGQGQHKKIIIACLSQNAEKVTHINRRLLDQATILFKCTPFQNGNFSL